MAGTIRWGILSTGSIADAFAQGLRALPDAEIVAVGSRSRETAERFGSRFGIPRRHASYEDLAADPGVDAVYIGTPHHLHHDNALLCLGAGKAVLCEKPFALNAAQAERMISAARSRGLFLMEALWSRYLPSWIRLRELVAAGAVGDVQMIEASFGFRAEFKPEGRLFNRELGGGALLDIGIYPLSLAFWLLGPPDRVSGMADIGPTGVDERSAVILGFPGGAIAVLHFSLTADMPSDALVMGTKAMIRLQAPIYRPQGLTIVRKILPGGASNRWPELVRRLGRSRLLSPLAKRWAGTRGRTLSLPATGNGYGYEAAEVGRCLRQGRTESASMPLDETLEIMRTMDRIRAPWGLRYPGE